MNLKNYVQIIIAIITVGLAGYGVYTGNITFEDFSNTAIEQSEVIDENLEIITSTGEVITETGIIDDGQIK